MGREDDAPPNPAPQMRHRQIHRLTFPHRTIVRKAPGRSIRRRRRARTRFAATRPASARNGVTRRQERRRPIAAYRRCKTASRRQSHANPTRGR